MSEHKTSNHRFHADYVDPSVFILLSREGFDKFFSNVTSLRNTRNKKPSEVDIHDINTIEESTLTLKAIINQAFTTDMVVHGNSKVIAFLRRCHDIYLYDEMLKFVCFNDIEPLYCKMKRMKKRVEEERALHNNRGLSAIDTHAE